MRNIAALASPVIAFSLLALFLASKQQNVGVSAADHAQTETSLPQARPIAAILAEFAVGKNGRLLFIPAKVNGRAVRLLLDTGCTRTGLDTSFVPYLGPSIGKTTLETSSGRIDVDVPLTYFLRI